MAGWRVSRAQSRDVRVPSGHVKAKIQMLEGVLASGLQYWAED